MRILALIVVAIAAAACQPADSAERSAEITSRAPVQATAASVVPGPALTMAAATPHSCGGGASCGGSCGGSCGAEAGKAEVTWNTPASAAWTELHVAGMHCGGCARRIERALAKVDGVLGVKVDLATASVKIATASGTDVRGLAKPAIDALGYQVQ